MTDCFQPCESTHKVTYQAIQALNEARIGYLIVTKSHLAAQPEYLSILDPKLAHIQISVTSLDDAHAALYEHASPPSMRVAALLALQERGIDATLRLSPLIAEYMDFEQLRGLGINRCVIEFLRINSRMIQRLPGIDTSQYTLHQSGYRHLPLKAKIRLVGKVSIPVKTVCDDVDEHYQYWKTHVNPNPFDCCNLQFKTA